MPAAVEAKPPRPRRLAMIAVPIKTKAQQSMVVPAATAPGTVTLPVPDRCCSLNGSDRLPFRLGSYGGQILRALAADVRCASEPDAEANPDVVYALVLFGEAAIRDVIDKPGDLIDRGDLITQLQRFAEQHVRAEALAVGLFPDDVAIVKAGPKEKPQDDAIVGLQHIPGQLPRPGSAEIRLIGKARGIDLAAERRAWLRHPPEIPWQTGGPRIGERRLQDDLGIEIDAVFLAAEELHVVGEDPELQLAVGQ